jgi:hypothetical protein
MQQREFNFMKEQLKLDQAKMAKAARSHRIRQLSNSFIFWQQWVMYQSNSLIITEEEAKVQALHAQRAQKMSGFLKKLEEKHIVSERTLTKATLSTKKAECKAKLIETNNADCKANLESPVEKSANERPSNKKMAGDLTLETIDDSPKIEKTVMKPPSKVQRPLPKEKSKLVKGGYCSF